MSFEVSFQPLGRRGACQPEQSLLALARELGIDLISLCGGHGHCGRCRVQIVSGQVTEPTAAERELISAHDLSEAIRLACQVQPLSALTVAVPADSLSTAMRTQIESRETDVTVAPTVHSYELELPEPSLEHPLADADSLLAALGRVAGPGVDVVDIGVLQHLSPDLRAWGWRCTASARGHEVIAIGPPGTRPVGLAIDLGTTGVAGYLVHLASGEVVAARGMMNPQIKFGEDVISRITFARASRESREALQRAAVDGLNRLTAELCAEAGLAAGDLVEAVIVGNTAMHHLLLGLPTEQLALAPFVPAVSSDVTIRARDIGLELAPGAHLYIPPNIAGFVGADHVAMLLATREEWQGKTAIALDIGTNSEISLLTPDGSISSLSCPSGPAFEGYHIKDGTRATTGAIERIQITPDGVRFQTIGGAAPAGICGSGILDAVGQMHLAGTLSHNGRILPASHPRIRVDDPLREFVLTEPGEQDGRKGISVTQEDVREILLAKAAIQTGIQVLLAETGTAAEELELIVIAGAFGSYIDVENAMAIGMFPKLPLERFKQVGNAAGAGARLALISDRVRADARELHGKVRYIELARYPGFARLFGQSCRLEPALATA